MITEYLHKKKQAKVSQNPPPKKHLNYLKHAFDGHKKNLRNLPKK